MIFEESSVLSAHHVTIRLAAVVLASAPLPALFAQTDAVSPSASVAVTVLGTDTTTVSTDSMVWD